MAIPSLLHPYNKLLTLKSAFPVRYEMLVESDEILRGGGPTSAGFVFLVFLKST